MNHRISLVGAAVLALGLSACSSTPKTPPETTRAAAAAPAPTRSTEAPAPAVATAPPVAVRATAPSASLPPYLDPASALSSRRSIYFDFDDFAIDRDDTALLEPHGAFLAGNGAVAIRVEGHTDERGSTEYNLALGQRRAEATRRALRVLGVRDGQMEAVSWGESQPRATGRDEAAWAENRRVDLLYPTR